MLTSSWGSWSTTTTLMRQTNTVRNAECGMRSVKVGVARRTTLPCNSAFRTPHSAFDSSHQLQHPEPLRILPVSTQPHPAVAAAPHELPRPADPAGKHLVDDEVEPYAPADVRAMPFRPRDGERDAIALARPAPRAPDGVGHPGRFPRPASAQPRAILPFGDHEEPGDVAALGVPQVQLQTVRVHVVGVVIEPQGGRVGRTEAYIGLRHLHGEVERVVVPRGERGGREVLRPGVRLLTAAVLVLEVEAERLARVEPGDRAVDRRRLAHAPRPADCPSRPVGLEQRHERRLRGPPGAPAPPPRGRGALPTAPPGGGARSG